MTTKARCPFCHSEVGAKAVCRSRKPGAFGLKRLSPGICGATPEAREAEHKRHADIARAQTEAAAKYERDLRHAS